MSGAKLLDGISGKNDLMRRREKPSKHRGAEQNINQDIRGQRGLLSAAEKLPSLK
ncbi:MAG: hypothetical protein MJA29_03520 [Candidatus Omnitrophica bacterium]|nr:hypothetical protein [Candidatus Omnitrophota bacterium]